MASFVITIVFIGTLSVCSNFSEDISDNLAVSSREFGDYLQKRQKSAFLDTLLDIEQNDWNTI